MKGAARLPAGTVVLTGDALGLVAAALQVAQRDRARQGLPPSAGWRALQALVSPSGHGDSPEGADPDHGSMSTSEAAAALGVSPRTVRRKASALGGRLVAGVLVFDAVTILEHKHGSENR